MSTCLEDRHKPMDVSEKGAVHHTGSGNANEVSNCAQRSSLFHELIASPPENSKEAGPEAGHANSSLVSLHILSLLLGSLQHRKCQNHEFVNQQRHDDRDWHVKLRVHHWVDDLLGCIWRL